MKAVYAPNPLLDPKPFGGIRGNNTPFNSLWWHCAFRHRLVLAVRRISHAYETPQLCGACCVLVPCLLQYVLVLLWSPWPERFCTSRELRKLPGCWRLDSPGTSTITTEQKFELHASAQFAPNLITDEADWTLAHYIQNVRLEPAAFIALPHSSNTGPCAGIALPATHQCSHMHG